MEEGILRCRYGLYDQESRRKELGLGIGVIKLGEACRSKEDESHDHESEEDGESYHLAVLVAGLIELARSEEPADDYRDGISHRNKGDIKDIVDRACVSFGSFDILFFVFRFLLLLFLRLVCQKIYPSQFFHRQKRRPEF